MTDPKPAKTLRLKKATSAEQSPEKGPQRSGARARRAAQLKLEREKQERLQKLEQQRKRKETAAAQQAKARSSNADSAGARRRGRRPTRSAGGRDMNRIYPIFASCPQGLEEALSSELQALGYDNVKAGRAGCHFMANWDGIMRANLYSRLATRILVQLAQAPVRTEDDILELARSVAWEDWFGPEHTLRVDTSAIRSPMQSLQYCNLRAKDGICDRIREQEGERPSIDTVRPDARVHLFLDHNSATLYLDSTGEALFKRGWRFDKGAAPLRENLAAGLLALSGWDPGAPLFDPFCGSGTILIEAAWITLGIPPGISRPFGFERLRDHDYRYWQDVKEDARSRIATQPDNILAGVDLDTQALDAARRNIERAGLAPDIIRLERADARAVVPPTPAPGWVVTNPPYGERLEAADDDLWPAWAANLKQHYDGWNVNVISSNLELPRALRLKPRRRHPLYNGALDCRLFNFEMVSNSYRDNA